jgi:hypothetical protein
MAAYPKSRGHVIMIPRLNRNKVLKEAKIFVGETGIPCLIENLSEAGAALILTEAACFEERFSLLGQGMSERSCEVVWRRSNLLGVKFV